MTVANLHMRIKNQVIKSLLRVSRIDFFDMTVANLRMRIQNQVSKSLLRVFRIDFSI